MAWICTFTSITLLLSYITAVVAETSNNEQTTTYRVNVTLKENNEIGSSVFELKNLKTVTPLGSFHGFLAQYTWIDSSNINHIKTNEIIDRDVLCPTKNKCVFKLEMLFINDAGHVHEVKININIADENDNRPIFPTFANNVYICSIIEEAEGDVRITLPLAEDLDTSTFGVKEYKLDGVSSDIFQLHYIIEKSEQQLYMTVSNKLDRELIDEYNFNLIAFEKGNDYMTSIKIKVKVMDIDDNVPTYDKDEYYVTINEGTYDKTHILTLKANDSDIGINAKMTYYVTGSRYVTVDRDTAMVSIWGVIDAYETPEIKVTLTSTSTSSYSQASTQIIIKVLEVNDHRPVISLYGQTRKLWVPETSDLEQIITKLHVKDHDHGIFGEFRCEMKHGAFRLQKEDENNFRIYTTQTIYDREIKDKYTLNVTCFDSPSTSSSKQLIIWVRDENDNSPKFTQHIYPLTVKENSELSEVLLTLDASDLDIDENAELSFSVEPVFADRVSIDRVTGDVRLKKPLDYEHEKQLEFIVIVSDNGLKIVRNDTSLVRLTIEDTDDQSPVFSHNGHFKFKVAENLPENTFIDTVTASDADSEMFAQFRFDLLPVSPFFSLDPISGKMYTKKPLDRENTPTHHLKVLATPTGSKGQTVSPYSVQALIDVTIQDENDHKPIFAEKNRTVKLSVGLKTGSLVSTIRAFDRDSDAYLRYGIVDGDQTASFILDPTSGQLRLAHNLRVPHISTSNQDNEIPAYNLKIRVYDGLYQDDMTLIIYVVEVNDLALFTTSNSRHNLSIVIAIASVSAVVIVTLSIAIVAVYRQRRKDNLRSKADGKRPLTNALADLSMTTNPCDLQKGKGDMKKISVDPELDFRRNSLTSVHSNASSLQLTNSFIKLHYQSKLDGSAPVMTSDHVTPVQGHHLTTPALTQPHGKDSDSGCSADMSGPNVWNMGRSTNHRDPRSSQYSPYYAPAAECSNHYDNMSEFSKNRSIIHGMQV